MSIEDLTNKKFELLREWSSIMDSKLYRIFCFKRKRINIIKGEIDDIERSIIMLKEPEFEKRKEETEALIKKKIRIS